jgi:hypothetical protein
MLRTFGMQSRPASMLWADIVRGPTRAEVAAHVARLVRFARNPK